MELEEAGRKSLGLGAAAPQVGPVLLQAVNSWELEQIHAMCTRPGDGLGVMASNKATCMNA